MRVIIKLKYLMKTILIPQPVYLQFPPSFIEDTNKENEIWAQFNKQKAIKKARQLADDQQRKVA